MTEYRAKPEQWEAIEEFAATSFYGPACLLELRARVEALEAAAHKHIVETSANILALASRVEALEAVKRPASKVYEISKPLKLTPEQAQHVRDLLAPNSKPTPNPSQIRSSLVERVMTAIERANGDDEARAAICEVLSYLCEHELIGNYARQQIEQEVAL